MSGSLARGAGEHQWSSPLLFLQHFLVGTEGAPWNRWDQMKPPDLFYFLDGTLVTLWDNRHERLPDDSRIQEFIPASAHNKRQRLSRVCRVEWIHNRQQEPIHQFYPLLYPVSLTFRLILREIGHHQLTWKFLDCGGKMRIHRKIQVDTETTM